MKSINFILFLPWFHIRCTRLPLLCNSPVNRGGGGCCKINCKLEKLEIWGENGRQEMIDYTFHETNVSRRVLHKQRLDPKPAFHTPVLHTLPSSLPHTIDDTTAILSVDSHSLPLGVLRLWRKGLQKQDHESPH